MIWCFANACDAKGINLKLLSSERFVLMALAGARLQSGICLARMGADAEGAQGGD